MSHPPASRRQRSAGGRGCDTGGACRSSRREKSGRHRPDRRSGVAKVRRPTAGRAHSKPGGTRRSTHIPHRQARSRNALRMRRHGRSLRWRSLALSERAADLSELAPASSARDHPSRSRAGTAAGPPSPALRARPGSPKPATGSWTSCRARRHIAARPRLSAAPSSAGPCRR